MFERNPKPSPDPLPSKQHAERFLAAQADRLMNRYTVDRQPIISTLAEIVHDGEVVVAGPRNEETPFQMTTEFISVVTRFHKAYMHAYKDDTRRYDPFDDQSLVHDEGFTQLSADEQQHVMEYLQHLTVESRGKHVAAEYIGTLAVFTVRDELIDTQIDTQVPTRTAQI